MLDENLIQIENGISNGYDGDVILVTGFGPFGVHKTNASWEAVKELEKIGLGDGLKLVTVMLDVEYDQIDSIIPELWEKYKPQLVVHCGVSGIAKELTLEQRGHRRGYAAKDEKGKIPIEEVCNSSEKDCIESSLQMDKACDAINKSACGVAAIVSHDAGRYLCDYTYFSSLSINPSRTAFIHVPLLDNPYPATQLAAAIKIAVVNLVEQTVCQCQDGAS